MSEKERHAFGETAGASSHPWSMSLRTPSLKRAAVSFLSCPHCMISLTISFDHSLSHPPLSFDKTFLRLFIIDSEIISAPFKVVNNSHHRYLSSEYQTRNHIPHQLSSDAPASNAQHSITLHFQNKIMKYNQPRDNKY